MRYSYSAPPDSCVEKNFRDRALYAYCIPAFANRSAERIRSATLVALRRSGDGWSSHCKVWLSSCSFPSIRNGEEFLCRLEQSSATFDENGVPLNKGGSAKVKS